MKTMFYSLIIKLGMFAATLGVVFWIGWSLPTSFDRERNIVAESIEGPEAEAFFRQWTRNHCEPIPCRLVDGSAAHCCCDETILTKGSSI